MKKHLLLNAALIASSFGAAPWPQVNERHFAPVSRYASPIEAFILNKIFEKNALVESKLFAGLREKAQDHHTRSSLYRENRSTLEDRGLKDAVKSLPEEKDFLKAQKLADSLLQSFYFNEYSSSPSSEVFRPDQDSPEQLPAFSSRTKEEYQFYMSPNPLAFNLGDPKLPYLYLGALPAEYGISLLHEDGFGLYPYEFKGESYVLALETNGDDLCSSKGVLYKCSAPLAPLGQMPPLLGVIGKGLPPQELWDKFTAQKEEKKTSSILVEALEDLAFTGHEASYDSPLIAAPAPGQLPSLDQAGPKVNAIIKKDSRFYPTKVIKAYYSPSDKRPDSATYSFSPELRLSPGESVYLKVPQELQSAPLANIILAHRQDPHDQRGRMDYDPRTGVKTYDKWPAYTSVQVHDRDLPYRNSWRIWAGPVSSDKGSKFAEIRNSPEKDNLYEWPLKGSLCLRTGSPLKRALHADLVKLEILGSDPAYIESVEIKTLPKKANHYIDLSFTRSKTDLGDPMTQKGRVYGGGQRFRGTYPGAKKIWPHDRGGKDFEIPVGGKVVRSVSLALGDTHPDGRPNRDGGIGSPGGASVSIGLVGADGHTRIILQDENLGPQGVVTASFDEGVPIEKISIRSDGDAAYLMGAQIGHD